MSDERKTLPPPPPPMPELDAIDVGVSRGPNYKPLLRRFIDWRKARKTSRQRTP